MGSDDPKTLVVWFINFLLAAFVGLLVWNGRRLVSQVENHAAEIKAIDGIKQAVQKLDADFRDMRGTMDKSRDQTAEEIRRLHDKMDANHSTIISILMTKDMA